MDLKGIEYVLVSTHLMLAAAFKVPELALSSSEGAALGTAIANVARHYPTFAATQQTIDWIALISVLVVTYGTRIAAYERRIKAEKQRGPNVTSLPQRPEMVVQ